MTTVVAGQGDSAGERPLAELEADLVALASDLAAAECRWLQMIEEFDRREGWAGFGVVSCAHWLSWRCGLSLSVAHEKMRVARALRTLPTVVSAFEKGELSYARTRAIVKAATPENEEALVELARHSTGAQLERVVRATVGVLQADEVKERAAQCYVRSHWAEDGSLIFRARLAPEQGAALLGAIEAAQGSSWNARHADAGEPVMGTDGDQAHGSAEEGERGAARGPHRGEPTVDAGEDEDKADDDEGHGDGGGHGEGHGGHGDGEAAQTREQRTLDQVDALVTVAEAYVAGHSPVGGADVYQVVVHVREDGPPHVEDGPPLPLPTALRLACDSSVYCVHEGARGEVLDIGRTTRRIPPAMRKALWLRDGGCRFPGCTLRRRVDAHHVVHWTAAGPTKLANLVLLCRRHHGLVHEGGFGLTMDPGQQPSFVRPDGSTLEDVPRQPTSARPPAGWHRRRVAERAVDTRWLGDKLDLAAAVDVVLRARAQRKGGSGPGPRSGRPDGMGRS